jgi:hypothetical protein
LRLSFLSPLTAPTPLGRSFGRSYGCFYEQFYGYSLVRGATSTYAGF